jgi:hypothetical protein
VYTSLGAQRKDQGYPIQDFSSPGRTESRFLST